LWIHVSGAAGCFSRKESPLLISRRREAKKRALLQMLDRIPIRTGQVKAAVKPQPTPVPAEVTVAAAGAGAPLQQLPKQ
jgi:hypothetical protein